MEATPSDPVFVAMKVLRVLLLLLAPVLCAGGLSCHKHRAPLDPSDTAATRGKGRPVPDDSNAISSADPDPGPNTEAPPAAKPAHPAKPSNAPENPLTAPSVLVRGIEQPDSYALVVGIEQYRDVPPAPGARSDAQDFAKVAQVTLGIPKDHIKVLLDGHATKGDIESGANWVKANEQKDGRVYFYFSGHGAPNATSRSSFVVPYDGEVATLDTSALPLGTVLAILAGGKASEIYAFVDACFSGTDLPDGKRPLVPVHAVVPPNGVLFSAAGDNEESGPDQTGKHGLFTKYLVRAIGFGEADQGGDGHISAEEVSAWVQGRVSRDADQAGRAQNPMLTLGERFKGHEPKEHEGRDEIVTRLSRARSPTSP